MPNDGDSPGARPTSTYPASPRRPLIVSAEDDRFGTAATARTIAKRVASRLLVIYPSGGHIWLGHDDDVADEIAGFVRGPSALRCPPAG